MCSRAAKISVIIAATLSILGASSGNNAQGLFDRAMSLWPNRDDMQSLSKSIDLWEASLLSNPEPVLERETRLMLSHAYYWYGNSLPEKDKDGRKKAYARGMSVLNTVLEKNPTDHEANFWYVVDLSSHAREVGILKSVSKLPEINRRIKIVQDKDPWYFYGGPNRLVAKIIQQAPGFLRKAYGYKLSDAEKILLENLERFPFYLMNRLFLAEVYASQDRIEEACYQLYMILNNPVDTNPAYAADNGRDTREAKKLLSQLQAKHPQKCK